MSNNRCPYCENELSDVKNHFHGRTLTGPHVHGLIGFCASCQIPFKRIMRWQLEDSGWYSTKIQQHDLLEELTKSQLLQLTEILSKYKVKSNKWSDFQKSKRTNDSLHFYSKKEETGICLVRNEIPLLNIEIKKFLLNKIN